MKIRASIIGLGMLGAGIIGGTIVAMSIPSKPSQVPVIKTKLSSSTSTTPTSTSPLQPATSTEAPVSIVPSAPSSSAVTTQPTSSSTTSNSTTTPTPPPVTVVSYKKIPLDSLGNIDCQYTYSDGTTYEWQWQKVNPQGAWMENSEGQGGHYVSSTSTNGYCDNSVIGMPKN